MSCRGRRSRHGGVGAGWAKKRVLAGAAAAHVGVGRTRPVPGRFGLLHHAERAAPAARRRPRPGADRRHGPVRTGSTRVTLAVTPASAAPEGRPPGRGGPAAAEARAARSARNEPGAGTRGAENLVHNPEVLRRRQAATTRAAAARVRCHRREDHPDVGRPRLRAHPGAISAGRRDRARPTEPRTSGRRRGPRTGRPMPYAP